MLLSLKRFSTLLDDLSGAALIYGGHAEALLNGISILLSTLICQHRINFLSASPVFQFLQMGAHHSFPVLRLPVQIVWPCQELKHNILLF